jgi:hypothetical protein
MSAVLATMFGLGFLHGLGLDHLMAIATLVRKGGSFRSSVWTGLRFGLGHMCLLAAAAAAGLVLRISIPARLESALEVLGGLLLIGLGIWVALDVKSANWVVHAHPHEHGADRHSHLHVHRTGLNEHRHSHLAWGLGAVFALSGVRSLLVMVPVVLAPSFGVALAYVLLFGLGIVAAMSLFGLAATQAYRFTGRDRALDRWASLLTGAASVLLGGYWVLQ